MKKNLRNIIMALIATFCASIYADNAVPTASKSKNKGVPSNIKMLTVDVTEVNEKYDKANEAQAMFNKTVDDTKKEINAMIQEGMKIGEDYNELQTKANNPALTDTAKKKLLDEANEKAKLIEEKQRQILQYKQQAEDALFQRNQSVTNLHLLDMKNACAKIAKEKGANLVLNTTGIPVMYADETADITEEVIKALNERK